MKWKDLKIQNQLKKEIEDNMNNKILKVLEDQIRENTRTIIHLGERVIELETRNYNNKSHRHCKVCCCPIIDNMISMVGSIEWKLSVCHDCIEVEGINHIQKNKGKK